MQSADYVAGLTGVLRALLCDTVKMCRVHVLCARALCVMCNYVLACVMLCVFVCSTCCSKYFVLLDSECVCLVPCACGEVTYSIVTVNTLHRP